MLRDGWVELPNEVDPGDLGVPDRSVDGDSIGALPTPRRPGQRNRRLASGTQKRRCRESLAAAIVVRHEWRNDHSAETPAERFRSRPVVRLSSWKRIEVPYWMVPLMTVDP